MKIMGIPDEEQIGMNPLKGLKMKGNERENRSYLYGFFFVVVLRFFGWFGFFVGFVLSGVHPHPPPHPPSSEQRASKKL